MALESVTHNWSSRQDMIDYWAVENHKTKSKKSKKKPKKKPISYYDILTGPQRWMLLSDYQKFMSKSREQSNSSHADSDSVPHKTCNVF